MTGSRDRRIGADSHARAPIRGRRLRGVGLTDALSGPGPLRPFDPLTMPLPLEVTARSQTTPSVSLTKNLANALTAKESPGCTGSDRAPPRLTR